MYEVAIIGGGAAGIACAKEALKAGLKTVLIEKGRESLGGTCLNQGCIPTKFFIKSSLSAGSWPDSLAGSQEVIEKIKVSLLLFLEKQNLELVWGQAEFLDKNSLKVSGKVIKAKNFIIATGSLPQAIIAGPEVIFAQDLFSRRSPGDKILIIGAGHIGLELASLLQNFGKDVTLLEKEEQILPSFDAYLAKRLRVILERKGIKIATGKSVKDYDLDNFDLVISAVGRQPNLDGLALEKVGLARDGKGWVKTGRDLRTNLKNVYACGDITGKKLLAYVAEYQARVCINTIMGRHYRENYQGLAECVFTYPSLAKVGILEAEAIAKGIKYRLIKSNFMKFSSSYVYGDSDGFMEILVDRRDRIIGAGIISQAAGELISIFSLCMRNNLKLDSLKKCVFIHPTLSEIIPQFLNS